MPKNLVIIESPGKLGKIKSFLGKDFDILASVGHVVDLPSKGLNVDVNNNFKPTYKIMPGKKEIVDKIKKAAKKAETVYLMMDSDREGSAIAFHIANQLPKSIPKESNPILLTKNNLVHFKYTIRNF